MSQSEGARFVTSVCTGSLLLGAAGLLQGNELDRSHLVSLISPGNHRSIRVAERLGERLECEVELPHMPGKPVLQYGMHKHDWQTR